MTEGEPVAWHHQFNGQEFEKTPELVMDREAWCAAGPWGHIEPDTTERLN